MTVNSAIKASRKAKLAEFGALRQRPFWYNRAQEIRNGQHWVNKLKTEIASLPERNARREKLLEELAQMEQQMRVVKQKREEQLERMTKHRREQQAVRRFR